MSTHVTIDIAIGELTPSSILNYY